MGLKPKITRELIRSKVGDANVFNFYFGDFDTSRNFHAVFRDDPKKSASFFVTPSGTLLYKDFGNEDTLDCVAFVMKLYQLNYYQAINQIATDFGLIAGERSSSKPALIKHIHKPKPKAEKKIEVGVIKFRKHHLDYWAQYGITEEELKANKVYAVNNTYINGWQIPTEEGSLRFAYLIIDCDGKEYIKVYSPNDENYKWVSNAPLNVPFGLHDLSQQSDTLIITKGQKDRILLKKYFTDVVAAQNESSGALKPEVCQAFKKLYKKVYVWFDFDRPGIKAANYYKKKYGFIPLFTTNKPQSIWRNLTEVKQKAIKDPSDFVKRFDLDIFTQYLKHLKLL